MFRSHAPPHHSPVNFVNAPRIAIFLVCGARKFELIGPSIVERILQVYENSDLFLHSPLDSNAYKFLLLNQAPITVVVKIFKPEAIPETESEARVLTARNLPNGIQETTALAGSFAGAIVCAVIASGASMDDALKATKVLAEDCRLR